jgi:hypothetical protein
MGKDLLFSFFANLNGVGQKYLAVMKDPGNGERLLLRLNASGMVPQPLVQDKWQLINATDIAQAEFFALSTSMSNGNNLYYTVGSKIYAYNVEDLQTYEVFDKPGEKITFFGRTGSNFIVCTYNETTKIGTFGVYTTPVLPNPFELSLTPALQPVTYSAPGKIVSAVAK